MLYNTCCIAIRGFNDPVIKVNSQKCATVDANPHFFTNDITFLSNIQKEVTKHFLFCN